MSELSVGTIVHLKTNGQTAVVKKLLGEGGQGWVYLASVEGKDMALKWYKSSPSTNPTVFYRNLCRNAVNGAPSNVFIWPKYVTEFEHGSFGYVMDLRPQGYYEFGLYLLGRQKFASFQALLVAAIDICEGFKSLHAQGLSYQDLNDGNFFIHPQTGHVLICDNDNAFPNGEMSGILGKARYMAPEVVVGKNLPNAYSDKYSLSVILFLLFYMNHPFEGIRVISSPCMTEELEKKYYGSELLFVCDPTYKSNQPVRGIHNNLIRRWPFLPGILRSTFIAEFGKDKLQNPTKRFTEQQWLDVITLVRDCLIKCPKCRKETFINMEVDNKCMECGKPIKIDRAFCIGKRRLALIRENNLYLNRDDNPELRVIAAPNDSQKDVIQNLTSDVWKVETPSGKIVSVEPNGIMPVKEGLVINMKIHGTMYKASIE